MGCAPIPQAPAAVRTLPDSWGAIASDEAGANVHGIAKGHPSRISAANYALRRCKESGGTQCRVYAAYANTCIFIAHPYVNGAYVQGAPIFALGGPESNAAYLAISDCEKKSGGSCRLDYSSCSLATP